MSQDYYNQQQQQQPYQQYPTGYTPSPLPYSGPGVAYGGPTRPGSVTGLGVVSLIFSILLLICTGVNYVSSNSISSSDRTRLEKSYPEVVQWDNIQIPVKCIGGLVMLVA